MDKLLKQFFVFALSTITVLEGLTKGFKNHQLDKVKQTHTDSIEFENAEHFEIVFSSSYEQEHSKETFIIVQSVADCEYNQPAFRKQLRMGRAGHVFEVTL